ncbi:MAG TPA: gephyrin-like molybdotransferase receptor GlpR [Actinophytocola sp.]|uniref:divisome protein SepX/GlpR n=1 Tax=Actinophytocola sp. TaxID=1872138 RepID=UPI002E0932A5|nr:gephyrin-like molybdotransferase receptor GlpR [Actinophytocola sp.]
MPSSLIIVALVVAWLVVLVPMIVRKRQEIARTADSALAARVVRSAEEVEEPPMRDDDQVDDPAPEPHPYRDEVDPVEHDPHLYGEDADPEAGEPGPTYRGGFDPETGDPVPHYDPPPRTYYQPDPPPRPYRPGRGGFDPEAAAIIARAKYAYRQRVVLALLVAAIVLAILAAIVFPLLWYPHGAVDIALISYLAYLRRQVRIEQEIRERRLARLRSAARIQAHQRALPVAEPTPEPAAPPRPAAPPPPPVPNATPLDFDDEDPAFADLDHPANLPYRRAAGE